MEEKLSSLDLHSIFVTSLDGFRMRDLFSFKLNYKTNLNHGTWYNYDEIKRFLEPSLNELLFTPLSNKYPELKNLAETFWEEFKTEKYMESVLSRLLADKVTVKDLKELLFIDKINYSDAARKDFLFKFISKDPTLINDLQNNLINTSYKIGDVRRSARKGDLMAYFDLLPKLHKEISNKDEVKDCFNLIKGTRLSPTNNTRALTTLFKVLPKTQETIDYIGDLFSKNLKEQHNLRAKYNDFSEKIIGFSNKKTATIIPEEIFTTKISLPDHILIDDYKISQHHISYIVDSFGNLIKNTLEPTNNKSKTYWQLNHPNPTYNTIYVYNKDFDSHIQTKKIIDKVFLEFDDIIDKFRLILAGVRVPSKEQTETLKKFIDNCTTKFTLEESLNKENISSTKKMKI